MEPSKVLGVLCAGGGIWAILFQQIHLGLVMALLGAMLLWGATEEEV